MDDPENGGGGDGPRRSTRGVPIYAIESLVISVVELGWMAIPRVAGAMPTAERALLLPLAVAGVLNVLMCSLAEDNRTALGAFASLSLTCTLGYLLVFLEAFSVEAYFQAFFGASPILLTFGSGTLAIMTLHSLLALAAVHERLWAQTAWIEGTLILTPLLLSVACVRSGQGTHGIVALTLALVFLAFTVILALVRGHSRVLFALARLAALAAAFTGSTVAVVAGLTRWAYPVMTAFVLFLLVCRSFDDWRQIGRAREEESQLQQVVHTAPPPAPAPAPSAPPMNAGHPTVYRAIPYTALRATNHQSAEAVMFSGQGKYLRQQTKKLI
jgi:hypothetical protein